MSNLSTIVGRVTRAYFTQGYWNGPNYVLEEYIVEVEVRRPADVRTYVAFGQNAITLNNFVNQGSTYAFDVDPYSKTEYDGELFSARFIQ